jgi:hypothetical protein
MLTCRMIGSAASNDWENYCMTDECMHITNLFLIMFIQIVNFIWRV